MHVALPGSKPCLGAAPSQGTAQQSKACSESSRQPWLQIGSPSLD